MLLKGLSLRSRDDSSKESSSCPNHDWTTDRVVEDVVKPLTGASGCRLVDLVRDESFELLQERDVGVADVFVSHCWGSKFGHTVLAAIEGANDERFCWLDVFSIPQHPTMIEEVDLRFDMVVAKCKVLLLVSPCPKELKKVWKEEKEIAPVLQTSIPFLRAWCLFEILAAIQTGIPLVMKVGNLKDRQFVATPGGQVSVYNNYYLRLQQVVDVENRSFAKFQHDTEIILNKVKETIGFETANRSIHGAINGAEWLYLRPEVSIALLNRDFSVMNKFGKDGSHREDAFDAMVAACAFGNYDLVVYSLEQLHLGPNGERT